MSLSIVVVYQTHIRSGLDLQPAAQRTSQTFEESLGQTLIEGLRPISRREIGASGILHGHRKEQPGNGTANGL